MPAKTSSCNLYKSLSVVDARKNKFFKKNLAKQVLAKQIFATSKNYCLWLCPQKQVLATSINL